MASGTVQLTPPPTATERCLTMLSGVHETGHSGMGHWDDAEGWDGEGGGWGVQDGEHMYTRGGFMSMYGKTHYTIVK